MKKLIVSTLVIFGIMAFNPFNADAQEKSSCMDKEKTEKSTETSAVNDSSFTVYGACGMCSSRIEKAALGTKGVEKAGYDLKTGTLTVSYTADACFTTLHKNIAAAGHDTEKEKADDKAYNALPKCCQYRKE